MLYESDGLFRPDVFWMCLGASEPQSLIVKVDWSLIKIHFHKKNDKDFFFSNKSCKEDLRWPISSPHSSDIKINSNMNIYKRTKVSLNLDSRNKSLQLYSIQSFS